MKTILARLSNKKLSDMATIIKNPFRLILLLFWVSSLLSFMVQTPTLANAQKQENESSMAAIENELVIIDKDLPDQDILLASLKTGIKIEYFDPDVDVLTSISNALKSNSPVRALHIVSYGAPGMIFTTSDIIDSKALESNTAEIRKENKTLQFITLTFHATDYYKQMAMEAGADHFFSKVDDFEKVAEVVNEYAEII